MSSFSLAMLFLYNVFAYFHSFVFSCTHSFKLLCNNILTNSIISKEVVFSAHQTHTHTHTQPKHPSHNVSRG